LAVAYTWPLAAHLADRVPHDSFDPLLNAFLLWWNAHRLPLTDAWWNAPFFFPLGGTISLSETLLGLSVVTTPMLYLGASPLLAYNAVYLLSFPLCGLATHLLVRELGGSRGVALAAGLAFAFAPYRAAQLPHLQVLCGFWVPLVFLWLHRYLRTGRRRDLALAAAAWMMQGLTNAYLFLFLSVVVAAWAAWFVVSARRWHALLSMALAFGVALLLPALVFVQYGPWHAKLAFVRRLDEIESLSADVLGFVSAPAALANWSLNLGVPPECRAFPGITLSGIVALSFLAWRRAKAESLTTGRAMLALSVLAAAAAAAAGLTAWIGPWRLGVRAVSVSVKALHKPMSVALYALVGAVAASPAVRRAWRQRSAPVFYGLAAAACAILALGPTPRAAGALWWDKAPYWLLLDLPGFSGLRVPARFAMLLAFCLACAAALGLARLTAGSRLRTLWIALAAAGVLWDGWILPLRLSPAPLVFDLPTEAPRDAVVLELPLGGEGDPHAMYRTTRHGHPVVNGYSGFDPAYYIALRQGLERAEDGVLDVLQRRAPLLVLVDPAAQEAPLMRDLVRRSGGTALPERPGGREAYVLPALDPLPPPRRGSRIAPLLVDGRTTRVLCDLGRVEPVGSLTLLFGRGVSRLPARVLVEVADTLPNWTVVWVGRVAGLAVEAALRDPRQVPVSIFFPEARGRYVRLRLFDVPMVEDVHVFRPAHATLPDPGTGVREEGGATPS
ncbi:MAG TPA: hypothetical protein VLL75_04030, partial [Vicinamibacteria bacterium]|nr:hypothetical protein [Vicinamibacteria bacterium]